MSFVGVGEKWRKMTPEEKKPFEELSVKHSAQLLEKHPDYRYRLEWNFTLLRSGRAEILTLSLFFRLLVVF
jgi:HMG (high mobility group) box